VDHLLTQISRHITQSGYCQLGSFADSNIKAYNPIRLLPTFEHSGVRNLPMLLGSVATALFSHWMCEISPCFSSKNVAVANPIFASSGSIGRILTPQCSVGNTLIGVVGLDIESTNVLSKS
jgi:hypothetical protein